MATTRYLDKDLKYFKSLIEEKIEKKGDPTEPKKPTEPYIKRRQLMTAIEPALLLPSEDDLRELRAMAKARTFNVIPPKIGKT